jgi:hypothetical protein
VYGLYADEVWVSFCGPHCVDTVALGDAAGRGKVQLTDYPCPRGPVTHEQLSIRELLYVPLEHVELGAADIGKMKIADFIH